MKEEEIRPQRLFAQYIQLAEEDARTYFPREGRIAISCPACSASGVLAFEKCGFQYEECPHCATLYVSPRPPAPQFERYYTQSPSSKFWATDFYRETAESRRERLWKPKARRIRDELQDRGLGSATVYDIGGGYGIFAEELGALGIRTIVVEPAPHLAAICRQRGLPTIEAFVESLLPDAIADTPKVFVSFELFEHLHDPRRFLTCIRELLAPGELFIFTTLSGTGVDIRALWEDSNAVMPPYHLNFLNPRSMRLLVDSVSMETLEITTPGRLDISILENNADLIKDRFWRTFVRVASEQEKSDCQRFISGNGWSSHMMVVCRRPLH